MWVMGIWVLSIPFRKFSLIKDSFSSIDKGKASVLKGFREAEWKGTWRSSGEIIPFTDEVQRQKVTFSTMEDRLSDGR